MKRTTKPDGDPRLLGVNPITDPKSRGGHPAVGPPAPLPTPRPTWMPAAAKRTGSPRPQLKPAGGKAYRQGPVVRS